MGKIEESNDLGQQDFERIHDSIERLEETIESFNGYVKDLKSYLESYLTEDPVLSEFSSIEEYHRHKEMPPISDEEIKGMNIDDLLEGLSSSSK